jgi:selenocysteine-specific elongation factor
MTVVIGTLGIDHGKTTLLRALTGMEPIGSPGAPGARRSTSVTPTSTARRLVAHFAASGHDRFIGNMLVGAGEIDAALVVVAWPMTARGPRRSSISSP